MFHSLVTELAQRRESKDRIGEIWELPSLQALLKCLPNDIDEIRSITEYKLTEIFLKM